MESGTILNQRYRIDELLAEGGMARVYRAHDLLLDRPVAVKILRELYAADEAFRERFGEEARAAAALAHANIVSVYDVGAEGDINYIVMELVDGPNLKQVIQQDGACNPARAMDISLQILAGLSFAHSRGVVHRDVKPQNILVASHGQVKVTDFGIARAAKASHRTETGLVMGSVHYCPPEQAMGQASTESSDVYSLGVVLYEMLTGRLPFESDNALGVALKHVQEAPPPLRQLNPQVPPGLEVIVLKAMAKDPSQRYANAEEMAQSLQAYRRIGEQGTAPFAAIPQRPLQSQVAGAGSAATSAAFAVPARRAGRGASDWLVLLFSVFILAMLAGWIPLAARLYDLYFSPLPPAPATEVQPPQQNAALPLATLPSTPTARTSPTGTPQPVTVPYLAGLTYSQAAQELERRNLSVTSLQEYSDKVPIGTVITQTVPPGSLLPPGATVGVVVSTGTKGIRVPSVLNVPVEEAQSQLRQLGLQVEVSDQFQDQVQPGRVAGQNPPADTTVFSGTVVSLAVSRGPRPSPTATIRPSYPTPTPTPRVDRRPGVPNLVGLPEYVAKQRIEEAGYANTYTNYQTVDDVAPANRDFFLSIPVGAVVSQEPVSGTYLSPGATIKLAVRRQ